MPRSEYAASGAIASTVSPCLPWRKLLSPGRSACRWSSGPGVGRLSGPERAVERAALRRAGRVERAVEPTARLEDRGEGRGRGPAERKTIGGLGGPRGPSLAGAGSWRPLDLGLAGLGYRGAWSRRKALRRRLKGRRRRAWSGAGEMSGLKRAFMETPRGDWKF